MIRFISYAGNHEDVLLNRVFRSKATGFYIDVGAHDPVLGSVTKALSDRGWTGINIEPNPRAAGKFARLRPRDANLSVAVGSNPGQFVFFELPDLPQLSTLSEDEAAAHRAVGRRVDEHTVEVTTLVAVCERFVGGRDIDLMCIDTEGTERDVLLGADFTRWRPKVLIIEATKPETNTPTHHAWEQIVLAANYQFCLFDGINRVYVRAESPELIAPLSYPVNCLDNYGSVWQYEAEQKADRYMRYGRPGRAAAWVVMTVCRAANWLVGRRSPANG